MCTQQVKLCRAPNLANIYLYKTISRLYIIKRKYIFPENSSLQKQMETISFVSVSVSSSAYNSQNSECTVTCGEIPAHPKPWTASWTTLSRTSGLQRDRGEEAHMGKPGFHMISQLHPWQNGETLKKLPELSFGCGANGWIYNLSQTLRYV